MSYGYYQPTYNNGAMPDMLGQYRQMQQPAMQMPQPMQSNDMMIWVQGEAAAKSYIVAPGNKVVLWDSEEPLIYIKSVDGAGLPSMKILEYSERSVPARRQNEPQRESVTLEMYNSLKGKFEALEAKLNSITQRGEEENG